MGKQVTNTCSQLYCLVNEFLKDLKYNLQMSYDEVSIVQDGYKTPRYIRQEQRKNAEKIIKFLRWLISSYPQFMNDRKGNYIEIYKFKHFINTQLAGKKLELDALQSQPTLWINEDEENKNQVQLEIKRLKYLNRFLAQGFEMLEFVYK